MSAPKFFPEYLRAFENKFASTCRINAISPLAGGRSPMLKGFEPSSGYSSLLTDSANIRDVMLFPALRRED